MNLPSLAFANQQNARRIIFVFSPNGVVKKEFWPTEEGGVIHASVFSNRSSHIRTKCWCSTACACAVMATAHSGGMGCLLTGIELFPGSIQGGPDETPAGWSRGISIDQESRISARERRRDPYPVWPDRRHGSRTAPTPGRAGATPARNKPIAPIDDPYQMFAKLYGRRAKDQEVLKSVLDGVTDDLKKVSSAVGSADKKLIEEHATFVREMEEELKQSKAADAHAVPVIEPGIRRDNDKMPQISKAQIDLMINAFTADFTRVASMQYTNSVGQARMKWLGVDEGHHALSHEGNDKLPAQEKLTKIDRWFAEQIAYMAKPPGRNPRAWWPRQPAR